MFRQFNTIEVCVKAFINEIPNYAKDALSDFGITERLRSVLSEHTLQHIGQPNYALFVNGDKESYFEFPEMSKSGPPLVRYLDGDVWVANAANSLITRFIDISWREDMLKAVTQIDRELRDSTFGRGILSSFDIQLAKIEDTVPGKILSAEQLVK